MATALSLIKRAMQRIGVLATGETPTADEATDALAELNDILENWSTERLTVARRLEIIAPLSQGVGTYTIGPGGVINTARPIAIAAAFVRIGGVDTPVAVVSDAEWFALDLKGMQAIPEWLRYDPAMPLASVSVWPLPSAGHELHLIVDAQFAALTDVNAQLVLPPGYSKALRLALAVELAGEFGRPVTPELAQLAADAKADIKRANMVPEAVPHDAGLLVTGLSAAYFFGGA